MGWVLRHTAIFDYYQCEELNTSRTIQAITAKNAGNMALHTGDEPREVVFRRDRFLASLRLQLRDLVAADQVHGTQTLLINRKMKGNGAFSPVDAIPGTDALITRDKGVVLSVFTADCLPIFIHDPAAPAVAVVHAGWRGVIGNIAGKTIAEMAADFKTDPAAYRVGIGPSICGNCFQVGADLAEKFARLYPETVRRDQFGYHVDLRMAAAVTLRDAGVKSISVIPVCTACEEESLFSYRAAAAAGRMMGIIALV